MSAFGLGGGLVEIHIEGLDRSLHSLERYEAAALAKRVQRGIRQGAKVIVALERQLAPKGPTGNLRRSIRAKSLRGGGVRIGPTAPHRYIVVRGTSVRHTRRGANRGRMAPHPFPTRALQQGRAEAIRIVLHELLHGT